MEFFRKSELILDSISVAITSNVDEGLALIEMNNVEVSGEDNLNVTVAENGVTASLDYEDLDELIMMLQQASETLKRKEQQFMEANL